MQRGNCSQRVWDQDGERGKREVSGRRTAADWDEEEVSRTLNGRKMERESEAKRTLQD